MKKMLTIGSMCDLKGDETNTKYLIIGYKKNGKDYESVKFPGGTTEENTYKYFNNDEIDEIYDLGYKDKEAIDYVKNLFEISKITFAGAKDTVTKQNLGEIRNPIPFESTKIDSMGVVSIEEMSSKVLPKTNVTNGIKFDADGYVIRDDTSINEFSTQPAVDNLKFDANGVVISQGE